MSEETNSTALYGQHIEEIRTTEWPDSTSQIYLDSSGQPLVPRSILNAVHNRLLCGPVISNPHSNSPSGSNTRQEIDQIRSLVCQEVFNVARQGGRIAETKDCEREIGWELVFTSGTTASLQTVARCFDFGESGRFAYLEQSHSSLLGLRDIVLEERGQRGAKGCDVIQEQEALEWVIQQSTKDGNSLLAVPLQCNATGKRYNKLISSIMKVREEAERKDPRRKVYILLDVASYMSPSTNLPLQSDSHNQPDFLCFSFLKILGYPSGLGGLLVLRESSSVLLNGKLYYGGGSLEAVTSQIRWRMPAREIKEALEDGTQNLFGILAVKSALEVLRSEKLLKSWREASDYVDSLTRNLWTAMTSLRHNNGSPLVQIYSARGEPWSESYSDDFFHLPRQSQGPIILFNVLRSTIRGNSLKACLIDPSEVDRLACIENIHLRSGRMCNVGAISQALELDEKDIQALWERGIGCGNVVPTQSQGQQELDAREEERLGSLISGCLRVSLSAWNTVDDLEQFLTFLQKYFLDEGNVDSDYESCEEDGLSEDHRLSDSDFEDQDSSQATSDTTHTSTDIDSTESEHYLKALYLYPIKSCASQSLTQEWKLTSTGLEYDRQFCIVDIGNGKIMSQKQVPKMARIRPKICLESQTMEVALVDEDGLVETVLVVPLQRLAEEANGNQRYEMCGKMHRPTLFNDEEIRRPLSNFLQRDCTLGQFSNESSYNKQDRTPLMYSNESPFLLISSESVSQICRWIQEEEGKEAEEDRVGQAFRSNFIIAGHQKTLAFHEDGARRVSIGPHTFAVMGSCRRCQMIALDQTTGISRPEILRVVAKHCRCQAGKLKGRLIFGLHLLWQSQWTDTDARSVMIRTGMTVRLNF